MGAPRCGEGTPAAPHVCRGRQLLPEPSGGGRCPPGFSAQRWAASGLAWRRPRAWRVQEHRPRWEGNLRLERQVACGNVKRPAGTDRTERTWAGQREGQCRVCKALHLGGVREMGGGARERPPALEVSVCEILGSRADESSPSAGVWEPVSRDRPPHCRATKGLLGAPAPGLSAPAPGGPTTPTYSGPGRLAL